MREFESEGGIRVKTEKKEDKWVSNHIQIGVGDIKVQGKDLLFFHENKLNKSSILDWNKEEKTITVLFNGNKFQLQIKDKYDALLSQLGLSGMTSKKLNDLKSPMPGLVVNVCVAEGEKIKKGTPLVILEAMKMENVLKAAADCEVKKINVEKGMAVEKNQILIHFL